MAPTVTSNLLALDVHSTNLHQMQDAILSIWANISKEYFQHLVESMQRRIKTEKKETRKQTCCVTPNNNSVTNTDTDREYVHTDTDLM